MIEVIGVIIILVLLSIVGLLYKIYTRPEPQTKEKVVAGISVFDPNKEINTIIPVPYEATTCSHDWEAVCDQLLEGTTENKHILVIKCHKCGMIDKTIQTVKSALPQPKAECRHQWVKEKSVTLDSAYEQIAKKNSNYGSKKDVDIDLGDPQPWMFRKTYISVRICQLCGEIDRCVAANFQEGEEFEPAEEQT